MKSFVLNEMILVSHLERRARRLSFHPQVTVIKGPNDTGKSCLLKSIYRTFGAEPAKVHPKWKSAGVVSLVRFSVGDQGYSIFRGGNSFSLFSEDDSHIGTYSKVTSQLAPQIAQLFDFNLVLPDRQGATTVLPPAFLFLPYYVDQDVSWGNNWSSFVNLGQFPRWKKDLVYYHTGIRSNEYYQIRQKIRGLERNREEPEQRRKVLIGVRRRLERTLANARFDIDVTAYRAEIDRLLRECEALKKKEESYKQKMIELDTERIRLQAQRDIVDLTRRELRADYDFALDRLEDDEVECPTCGTVHSNSFKERFAIAQDEERCVGLLVELRDAIAANATDLAKQRSRLDEASADIESIEAILAEKQGDVTLKTLIENEGKKQLGRSLDRELESLTAAITAIDQQLADARSRLKTVDSPERRNEILGFYRNQMRRNLHQLAVNTLAEESYKQIDCTIRESGSDLPRALLAYYFSILKTVRAFGTSAFCPIVIDSPNTQDQDVTNYEGMLTLIKEQRPKDGQLVLGLVDDCDIDFGGTVVDMQERNYALSESQYSEARELIRRFEEINLFGVQG